MTTPSPHPEDHGNRVREYSHAFTAIALLVSKDKLFLAPKQIDPRKYAEIRARERKQNLMPEGFLSAESLNPKLFAKVYVFSV